MKFPLSRVLAVAFLAAFTLANTGNAATILIFGQQNTAPPNPDVVTETHSGNTTTLTTGPSASGATIPIQFTNLGGLPNPAPPNNVGFETFTLTSTTAAVGTQQGGFSGTISFTTGANGTGNNFLTLTITGGVLTLNGATAGFTANNVAATSGFGAVQAVLGGPTGFADISIAFADRTATSATTFTSTNGGPVSTAAGVIPEPASIVMASISVLAGLGCFGWRRFKAPKA